MFLIPAITCFKILDHFTELYDRLATVVVERGSFGRKCRHTAQGGMLPIPMLKKMLLKYQ